jgi:hypothetical protein
MSLPSCDDIVTPHLSLIAITPEMLNSERTNDHHRLGELLQSAIPTNWPPVDWEPHVLDFILAQFQQHPEQIGWHRYVIFRHPDSARSLIGALGAFSKGVPPSECEIGYSILPPFEGRGFAVTSESTVSSPTHFHVSRHPFGSWKSADSSSTERVKRQERFAIGYSCANAAIIL